MNAMQWIRFFKLPTAPKLRALLLAMRCGYIEVGGLALPVDNCLTRAYWKAYLFLSEKDADLVVSYMESIDADNRARLDSIRHHH